MGAVAARRIGKQLRTAHDSDEAQRGGRAGPLVTMGRIAESAESTLSAVLGAPTGLFRSPGPVFAAELALDGVGRVLAGSELFRGGGTVPVVVKFSEPTEDAAARTCCLKVRDAYGQGHDQDFLLASSLDGAPGHHAVVHRRRTEGLYSSLWLYLSGIQPVAFGARVGALTEPGRPSDGDRIDFLAAGALSRFDCVGEVTLRSELPLATVSFAGWHCGGGLRALPPALLYTG